MMKRSVGLTVACAAAAASIAAVAAAPAALAVVAHPKAGSYSQVNKAGDRSYFSFTLSKGHVKNAIHYDNCVRVPIMTPSIKVSSGKFSFTGKRTDVVGNTWKIHVDGAFVKKTVAKGNWSAKQLSGGSCTSTFAYKATWQQS